MGKTYINGLGCISAQKTFEGVFLEEFDCNINENVLPVKTPVYKDYIPPVAIRRMAKGVKNGIVAANLAMKEAGVENLDAIITGTGMGCIEDSDKFLKALIDNNEEFLTPTSFIQSTHNTVGSQIALGIQCKAYNFTYVNAAVSFESALLDAKMQFDTDESSAILVGGIDEMSEYTSRLFKLSGFIKADDDAPYQVLDSKTKGAVYSEGATFFTLENKKTASTYAEIIDVDMVNTLTVEEVQNKMIEFLKLNNLDIKDIDAVVLGYNGDVEYDIYYKSVAESVLKNTTQIYYKHLSGEYNTASAFGLWVASKIIKTQGIPDILKINAIEKPEYKRILLYNQYKGLDHSFTLISKC
ncbi:MULTISPECIES: beta-ketoacyl synthase N-terminal-like domain-containing protein [Flavobacterium]|uniref:Beta-ketoacyl synthase N-terminal-like domain-containing protein n=1 Tax=Flavobacterium jumunjinense TaxID=998845 RepID=A0ABV5GKP9_9FLAO|nr:MULTISPECIES: beta-ketoacyl synthase N-terminal-like domain-containing protein [Flavobacterium]